MERLGEILLADADVLIDYRDSEPAILALVAEHLAPLKVLTLVQDQVRGLTPRRCQTLGIEIVEPTLAELMAAMGWQRRLGLVDAVCLASAVGRGWTLVTNDRALGNACRGAGAPVLRGLGLMLELVALGALTRLRAVRVARLMQQGNPVHLHEGVLEAFERELGGS